MEKDRETSSCPAETVSRTNPNNRTVKGSTVVIYISNGTAAPGPGQPSKPPGPGNGGNNGPNPRDICQIFPAVCPPPRD